MSDSWDVKAFNAKVIAEFRANGGRVSSLPAATPLLLLTTTGARSGQQRTSPLGYLGDGDRYYINGAVRGAPIHPAWSQPPGERGRHGRARPGKVLDATARVLVGDERQRIWDQFAARIPPLTAWQDAISRQFPIVALTRTR